MITIDKISIDIDTYSKAIAILDFANDIKKHNMAMPVKTLNNNEQCIGRLTKGVFDNLLINCGDTFEIQKGSYYNWGFIPKDLNFKNFIYAANTLKSTIPKVTDVHLKFNSVCETYAKFTRYTTLNLFTFTNQVVTYNRSFINCLSVYIKDYNDMYEAYVIEKEKADKIIQDKENKKATECETKKSEPKVILSPRKRPAKDKIQDIYNEITKRHKGDAQ